MDSFAPVITVDGPAAAGKGAVARRVAATLQFHYLDSGQLYRALALAITRNKLSSDDEAEISTIAVGLTHHPKQLAALLQSPELVSNSTARIASVIAIYPRVRKALVELQRMARQKPGLVADGRDMGTVIFPEAAVKIFLTAALSVRAKRRFAQLRGRGNHARMEEVCVEIERRDWRDQERSESPLACADGALVLDSTNLTIDNVVQIIIARFRDVVVLSSPPA